MRNKQKGVTFIELLLVIGIISVVAVVGMLFFNPKRQLEKAWDARKKNDISSINRTFEEYFNDNGTYPAQEVCDDEPVLVNQICTCHICKFSNSSLPSYLNSALCSFPNLAQKYLYQYDCTGAKPEWYELCGALSPSSSEGQAQMGVVYNFGTSSPNRRFNYCN